MAEHPRVLFNGFTHLLPEGGLPDQGFLAKDLLHESPPLN